MVEKLSKEAKKSLDTIRKVFEEKGNSSVAFGIFIAEDGWTSVIMQGEFIRIAGTVADVMKTNEDFAKVIATATLLSKVEGDVRFEKKSK